MLARLRSRLAYAAVLSTALLVGSNVIAVAADHTLTRLQSKLAHAGVLAALALLLIGA
jgi:hypothetical protein